MPAFQKACYTWLTRYIQLHHDIELSERDIRMLVGGEFFPEDAASLNKSEVDKKKEEIKELFTRLCVSLDRLCNTHFTPSANTSTFSVVSSAPALSMEEALPISVSAETQKAPEEG